MTASTLPIDAQTTVANVNTANHAAGGTNTYENTPTLELTTALINTAWTLGQTIKSDYTAKSADAVATIPAAGGLDITAGTVSAPTITEPAVSIPATVDSTQVMSLFDTKYLELVQLLSDKFVAFRTAYFPDESTAYTAAEDWLQAAIADPSGLPSAVATQILTDDRDRLLADKTRAQADVLATFSAKRFPLPPGAAASAILQIEQTTQDKIAESSRKVVIASVEQFRFVVGQIMNLRISAMDAAVKYITALASGPEMASKLIGVGYDAQSKLITAAASFYNARSQAAEVVSKANQFNVGTAIQAAEKNQATDLSLVENKVRALIADAELLGRMAASLFNNLHAAVETRHAEG